MKSLSLVIVGAILLVGGLLMWLAWHQPVIGIVLDVLAFVPLGAASTRGRGAHPHSMRRDSHFDT
jgi:hypothetical protein